MLTILIVEDEISIAGLMGKILKAEGYNIIIAHNGQDGLLKAQKYLPSIILSDITMPIMTGPEMFQQLQQSETHKNTLFVFVSGGPYTPQKNICTYHALLSKPFSIKTLITTLEELIRIRAQQMSSPTLL